MEAATFANDVAAAMADQVNLGVIVTVTLPDGNNTVQAQRTGFSGGLGMELTGYSDNRQDEISVLASQFDGLTVPSAKQVISIDLGIPDVPPQSWVIDNVEHPDATIYFFRLSQNW